MNSFALSRRRALFSLLALAAWSPCAVVAADAANAPDSSLFFASRLPDMNGRTVDMSAFRGRPLIVNFWASWCAPCREEMPALMALWRKYRAAGLVVIGVGMEDDSPAVRSFVRRFAIDFPLLLPGMGGMRVMRSLGDISGGLPYTVAINRAGEVVASKLGRISAAQLESAAVAALR